MEVDSDKNADGDDDTVAVTVAVVGEEWPNEVRAEAVGAAKAGTGTVVGESGAEFKGQVDVGQSHSDNGNGKEGSDEEREAGIEGEREEEETVEKGKEREGENETQKGERKRKREPIVQYGIKLKRRLQLAAIKVLLGWENLTLEEVCSLSLLSSLFLSLSLSLSLSRSLSLSLSLSLSPLSSFSSYSLI
jgi:hypothetical protein